MQEIQNLAKILSFHTVINVQAISSRLDESVHSQLGQMLGVLTGSIRKLADVHPVKTEYYNAKDEPYGTYEAVKVEMIDNTQNPA